MFKLLVQSGFQKLGLSLSKLEAILQLQKMRLKNDSRKQRFLGANQLDRPNKRPFSGTPRMATCDAGRGRGRLARTRLLVTLFVL